MTTEIYILKNTEGSILGVYIKKINVFSVAYDFLKKNINCFIEVYLSDSGVEIERYLFDNDKYLFYSNVTGNCYFPENSPVETLQAKLRNESGVSFNQSIKVSNVNNSINRNNLKQNNTSNLANALKQPVINTGEFLLKHMKSASDNLNKHLNENSKSPKDAKEELLEKLKRLEESKKMQEKEIKKDKKKLDKIHQKTSEKINSISDQKYQFEKKQQKMQEKINIFNSDRRTYFQMKTEIREQKLSEEDIKEKMELFSEKYFIFKQMDLDGEINKDTAMDIFMKKIQEFKYEEYLFDKKIYFNFKKSILKENITREDVDPEFRQRFEVFNVIDQESMLSDYNKDAFRENPEKVIQEYDKFIELYAIMSKESKKSFYQPHNREYVKDVVRPTLEITRKDGKQKKSTKNEKNTKPEKKLLEQSKPNFHSQSYAGIFE